MARFICLSLIVALASDQLANAQQKEPAKKLTNDLGMEFALVPKGKSWLGGGLGKEGTKEVNIAQDFYLGVYAVTQEEWQKVMDKNPSNFSRDGKGAISVKDIPDADLKRFPVENLTWMEAKEFVKLLNEKAKKDGWEYCLPTAEQWEYACRGGPMTDKADGAFDFYLEKPSKELSKEQANFDDSGLGRPCKVGSYKPNRLGLYDMHGNIRQWGEDQIEPTNDERVVLGSSFGNDANRSRAAFRYSQYSIARDLTVGIRVALVSAKSK